MDCITAGNAMVQLFMQTKPRYYLNNQKLQYLLCIAQMTGVNAGRPLFQDPIRNLKNNFAIEAIADTFTRTCAIQEGKVKQEKLDLTYEDLVLPYSTKRIYAFKESISDEDQRLLMDVFIRFGGYSEKALCKLLNEFKPLKDLPVWSYISAQKLNEFFTGTDASLGAFGENEVFSFCLEGSVDEDVAVPEAEDVTEVEAVEPEPEKAAVPEVVAVPTYVSILNAQLAAGLKKMVVGKQYSLYIEAPPHNPLKDITIISLKDNQRVAGKLKQVNSTVYCYSFAGVASDIKISVDI